MSRIRRLFVYEGVIIQCGLGPGQNERVDKLYQHELGQVEWQHGESDTVEHRWEKGAKSQSVEEGTLAHQIRDGVDVKRESIGEEDELKVIEL